MRLLLDTCTFLWAAGSPEKLSEVARVAVAAGENEVFVSAVSAWEIHLKSRKPGSLRLDRPAASFVRDAMVRLGVVEIPIRCEALAYLDRLPDVHGDPFDRTLICQAIHEDCTLVTPDAQIARYPVRVIW
ncbi:MAG: type II toxin-antitoxin system VapC family toxin [Deltaproteobacteria bacterium]|nr:type II toxin-antitoxin system VapC family toxin [Deltaproteobacteria bacterium]